MDLFYASEKFSVARSNLMLPHSRGEAQSIADAFHECHLALMDHDLDNLDDNAKSWVLELKGFMNTRGLEDSSGKGLWAVKAETFSVDQKLRISHLVDELANWFESESRDSLGT